jgi:hypothetical protein
MDYCRVFPLKSVPDPQAMPEMQKRVEQLQGKKVGPWNVTCYVYHAKQPPTPPTAKGQLPSQQLLMRTDVARELLLINFDDSATKAYLLARDSVLEADKEISTILERSKLYALKYPIDVKGHHYTMGDFVVKLGTIFVKDAARGSLMEVEYCPSVLPNQCHKIMGELLSMIGPFDSEVHPTFDFSTMLTLPEVYSHHHTAVQYAALFKNMNMIPKT